MRSYSLPSDGQFVKKNGKILSWVLRFFEEQTPIPHPKIIIPWMHNEQKYSYASERFNYKFKTDRKAKRKNIEPESYYENRFYELVVGSLLRQYILEKNPKALFYYASKHDDYFSGCDYIVSQSGNANELIWIDLTVGSRGIWGHGLWHSVWEKIKNFQEKSNIPLEFFQTVMPHLEPRSLPFIVIRVSLPILLAFANDFFAHVAEGKKSPTDILRSFSSFVNTYAQSANDRVSHILWMGSDQEIGISRNGYLGKLTTEINMLFPQGDRVSFIKK